MNTTPGQWLKLAGKLSVLVLTAGLLLATSPADDCPEWTAPVTFQATGTCGPGGLIVVEASGSNSSVRVANATSLGLPLSEAQPGVNGRYRGNACPFTLEEGEWDFTLQTCRNLDGDGGLSGFGGQSGTDGGTDGGLSPRADGGAGTRCVHRCEAHRTADNPLLFTCTDPQGNVVCQSLLVKVVSP